MEDRIEFDCGIAQALVASWLDDELNLPHHLENTWLFELHADSSCSVSVSPIPSSHLGTLEIERCMLTAQGDRSALEEFERRFWLRFASAGG